MAILLCYLLLGLQWILFPQFIQLHDNGRIREPFGGVSVVHAVDQPLYTLGAVFAAGQLNNYWYKLSVKWLQTTRVLKDAISMQMCAFKQTNMTLNDFILHI